MKMNQGSFWLALALLFIAFASGEGGELPTGHWIAGRDAVEEYRRFVREEDGKILIEIMHAWNSSASPWGVYKNGASLGDYLTEEQAKSAAERALKK